MPVPYYTDNELLGENDLNKVKNTINKKMKELYSILGEPATLNEGVIPDFTSGKTDVLVNEIIDLLVKNGSLLIGASSYIITKDGLTKAQIKTIKDQITQIEDDWKKWMSNRPDQAELQKITDLNKAINDLSILKESEDQLNEEKNKLLDMDSKLNEAKTGATADELKLNTEIADLQSQLGQPSVKVITASQETNVRDEFKSSSPEIIDKIKLLEDTIKQYESGVKKIEPLEKQLLKIKNISQTDSPLIDSINTKIDTLNSNIKKLESEIVANIKDNSTYNAKIKKFEKELELRKVALAADPTNSTLQTEISDTETQISEFKKKLISEADIKKKNDEIEKNKKEIDKLNANKEKLNINVELYNSTILDLYKKLYNEYQIFNPKEDININDKTELESYLTDSKAIVSNILNKIQKETNDLDTLEQNYLDQYLIDNNLSPISDTERNKKISELQKEITDLNDFIVLKEKEYNDYKLTVDQFENDLKLKLTSTQSNINTAFGTTDPDVLQAEITRLENITGMNMNTTYKKYLGDLEIENAKLNINLSVFNATKVKIDTDSLIDFDKNINKIINNFKILNDEFKTVIENSSTISEPKYNKLIKTYDRFKIDCLLIKQKIKQLPGDKLSLSGSQGQLKIQFADIENNVKSLFDLLNQFDIKINELKQKYNVTRPIIGSGRFNNRYM